MAEIKEFCFAGFPAKDNCLALAHFIFMNDNCNSTLQLMSPFSYLYTHELEWQEKGKNCNFRPV